MLHISDLDQYTCGKDDDLDDSRDLVQKPGRLSRLREYFRENGPMRSVRAVMLVHVHRLPHVLLLQRRRANDVAPRFLLPGGKLDPGEDDESGLARLLDKKLQLVDGSYDFNEGLIATWYRAQFTEQMLPYLPVHIATAKETEFWYFVKLPERGRLRIHQKYDLVPRSFYDLQDGADNYGKQLQVIPLLASRFNLIPR
jgi:cleavage and polyadenylation specificity factor subunit 5